MDLTKTAVREWVRQADIDDGHRDGLTLAQRAELVQLRKQKRVLREGTYILKRAPAFFAFLGDPVNVFRSSRRSRPGTANSAGTSSRRRRSSTI